jgi:hypothetical protein
MLRYGPASDLDLRRTRSHTRKWQAAMVAAAQDEARARTDLNAAAAAKATASRDYAAAPAATQRGYAARAAAAKDAKQAQADREAASSRSDQRDSAPVTGVTLESPVQPLFSTRRNWPTDHGLTLRHAGVI